MHQIEEVEHEKLTAHFTARGIDRFGFAHKREAGRLAARVDLDAKRLQRAILQAAIDKPDHERHHPMHARTTSGKKFPCALFAARHQWLAASVQNKNCHVDPLNVSTACPLLLAFTGLVTGAA